MKDIRMENKLELKHLSPYLPYGLKVKRTFNNEIMLLFGTSGNTTIEAVDLNNIESCALLAYGNCEISYDEHFKPILHPLSDLTKEIEHNGEKFVPLTEICNCEYYGYSELRNMVQTNNFYLINALQYQSIEKLFEWHFDVFGLIEKGLAIDINTLK